MTLSGIITSQRLLGCQKIQTGPHSRTFRHLPPGSAKDRDVRRGASPAGPAAQEMLQLSAGWGLDWVPRQRRTRREACSGSAVSVSTGAQDNYIMRLLRSLAALAGAG